VKGKATSGRHDSRDIEPRSPELVAPGRRGRSDSGDAFIPDPEEGSPAHSDDDLAETLAEDFLRSATTGEDSEDDTMDQIVPEEIGGPFVETSAAEEFALGPDESNPDDAMVEPLPRAIHGLSSRPRRS
jgi:hypothetical protein